MTRPARTLDDEAVVGHGRAAFDAAAHGLLGWQMHRLAGVRVQAAEGIVPVPGARAGLTVAVGVGPRLLGLGGRCEVLRVVAEPDHVSMTYRTAPDHPEHGVQTFEVTLLPDGRVRACVTSTSVPRHPLLRAVPAAGRAGQRAIARRYLRGLRRLAEAAPAALG